MDRQRVTWIVVKACVFAAWVYLYIFVAFVALMGTAHSEAPYWPTIVFLVGVGLVWLAVTYRLLRRWVRRYRVRFASPAP